MASISRMLRWSHLLMTMRLISAVSFNQPKFCPNATWDPVATTFATSSTAGIAPRGIFITTHNTVVVPNRSNGQIIIWPNGSSNASSIILANLSDPWSVFVTSDNEIFVDNNSPNNRIEKWTFNKTRLASPMFIGMHCAGLFVDIYNDLYCAQDDRHQVLKKLLNDPTKATVIIAGTACNGSASNMLNGPNGIFITERLDLYVADWGNDRVQLFRSGELNGATVAGNGSTETIELFHPISIVLDADGYLFILDGGNSRIVGSGPYGFRCVAGCSGSNGSTSDRLYWPEGMSFDVEGNIYVTEAFNDRIQKFLLSSNSCDATTMAASTTQNPLEQTTSPQQLTSTITTSHSPIDNQSCSSPMLTLIPSTSNLSFPLQYRRNQDFFLSSNIELTCNLSRAISMTWSIKTCSSSVCLSSFPLDSTMISNNLADFYIPSRTLPCGLYELTLTVTRNVSSNLTSSKSAYVRIIPSGFTVKLVPLGASMITSGFEQDLLLNPGLYSVDLDGDQFNASNWNYQYYCRIYDVSNFPRLNGSMIPLDDARIDPLNPACLVNRSSSVVTQLSKSTVLIRGGSFQSNRTYQLMVEMQNKQNDTLKVNGSVLVRVQDTASPMIVIGCAISTLCVPDLEFQLINPTTQVALFALCLGQCSSQRNISWNIYQGSINASSNFTQWTLFNQMNIWRDIWFFGSNTSNFTSTEALFLTYPQIDLWRFEVVYSFPTATSSSALNVLINQPPSNGSCSIGPSNGTTTTPFDVSCPNWFDQNDIKDYSLYLWSSVPSERIMIAFSSISTFQVRLPSGTEPTFSLSFVIYIRDTRDCITEWNLTSVVVRSDSAALNDLINELGDPSGGLTNNPFTQLLLKGNPNTVGQVISSLSQQLNPMNTRNLRDAVSSGVPAASISVSLLEIQRPSSSLIPAVPLNSSAWDQFNIELNSQANVREYLIGFITSLPIASLNTIQIQSAALAQLTQATNQLTRTFLVAASNRCYQLAKALQSMADRIPVEDLQMSVTQLMQCSTNLITAANAPLQQRTTVLNSDLRQDYETDLESEWSKFNVDWNDDSTSMTIEQRRNLFYQQRLAHQVSRQMNELTSLLTKALNIHLNIGQQFKIKSPSVFMSLETLSADALMDNARIRLPTLFHRSFNGTERILLRSTFEPLAVFGQSNTNLSRSISLTLLDQDGNGLSLDTTVELLIPRDPSLIIPPMFLQNVTSPSPHHHQLFNLHHVDLSGMSDVSVHFELHPLSINLSYLLIYRFDRPPVLNTSLQQIDGWSLFCPANLSNTSLYTLLIDNHQTLNHRSVIFGLREVNNSCSTMTDPPLTNERFHFTDNYELRLFTSACYYLDGSGQWRSDGMTVGPLTTHFETQCFSTHLN